MAAIEPCLNGSLDQYSGPPFTRTVRGKLTVARLVAATGERFDRIINYQFGPVPPRLDGSDERDDGNLPPYEQMPDDSEVPF